VVDRADAHRSDPQEDEPLAECAIEPERDRVVLRGGPLCNHHRDGLGAEPTDRVLERTAGRSVAPLDIVDCHEDGGGVAQRTERAEDGDRDGSVVDVAGRPLASQQSHLERAPLGVGELREHVVECRVEEIAEGRERQVGLRLCRSCREDHGVVSPSGHRQRLVPQRRLADPGLALEDQRSRSFGDPLEARGNNRELGLPTDEFLRHLPG
jgi:hypothetical protein